MSDIKTTQSIAQNWQAAVDAGAANAPNRVTAAESARILEVVKGGFGVSQGELDAATKLWGDVQSKYDAALQARSAAEDSLAGLADAELQLNAFLGTMDGILYVLEKTGTDDPISAVFAGDQKATIAAMKAEIAGARAALAAAIETLSAAQANLAQATDLRDAIVAERNDQFDLTSSVIDRFFEVPQG